MGLKRDLQRLREVGEERRQDLAEFIEEGEFRASTSEEIRVPVKIVDLPEFAYDPLDEGGVGMTGDADAEPDVGQPVDVPVDEAGDGDDGEGDGDEAGEGDGEHAYYEMDPEEFARELDDRLGLDLEPKGKTVVEETEGPLTDVSRQGPPGTLMMEDWFTEGLKRKLATDFDGDYVREALRVEGWDADRVFEWAREQNIPVSHAWIADAASELEDDAAWESIEEMEDNVERERPADRIRRKGIDSVPLRREDQRFRHPETEAVHEKNVVVVNIRDVSGSMGEAKRELVERVFTPMDWYLQGKYDHAEFVYVAHDAEAWEVDRDDFFGIQSGGGTRISAAYELVADRLDEEYPWSEWNRYVFAAGDGENRRTDTRDNVVPLMDSIDANLHAYVQVQPGSSARGTTHADRLLETFDGSDGVAVVPVDTPGQVTGAIEEILSTEDTDE